MNWYLKVLQNYANFEGRARRKEYWMFALFNAIFGIITMIIDNLIGFTLGELPYGILYVLYSVVVFIPSLAVIVRRLHDTGKSGWMLLIALIPIIGSIWLLVLLATDSDPGENQYGPNPKSSTEVVANTAINNNSKDTIILVVVAYMLFTSLFWLIIPKLFEDFYDRSWFEATSTIMNTLYGFIPLALAFTVRNKSIRIVLFILGGIYLAIDVYGLIERFLH